VTRILIADDHEVVRSGLRKILEAQAGWEVVAEVGDGIDAITGAIETKPDVAVLDYSLPRANGAEVARQIRARLPTTEILIFTMHDNEHLVQEALRAGARGYLLKSDAKHYLIEAIRSLAIHKPFFTSKVSEALLGPFVAGAKSKKSVLSNRERGVVQLIADPQPQHQDGGDTPISHDAQARSSLLCRGRALCGPQQVLGGLNQREFEPRHTRVSPHWKARHRSRFAARLAAVFTLTQSRHSPEL
jgi:DNA-binding NarL/FixJ family response regulator